MTRFSYKPGDRVGAILGTDNKTKTIEFLGYGIYEGDFDLKDPIYNPAPIGAVVEMAKYCKMLLNPRIKLDNGQVVWGCECWWGAEDKIKKLIDKYISDSFTIKLADINKVRKNYDGT